MPEPTLLNRQVLPEGAGAQDSNLGNKPKVDDPVLQSQSHIPCPEHLTTVKLDSVKSLLVSELV